MPSLLFFCIKDTEIKTIIKKKKDKSGTPLPKLYPPMIFVPSARYSVGFCAIRGYRRYMEDESVILGKGPRFIDNEDFFAIYDGHGGEEISYFLSNNFHKILQQGLEKYNDVKEAIYKTFIDANENIIKDDLVSKAGSTAAIVYIKDKTLYFANCGDTRIVLSSGLKSVRCSIDHKPYINEETKRIESRGGFVSIEFGIDRVNGVLAVSRSFGDKFLYPIVDSEPFIKEMKITDDMNFFIIASDGLWDYITDEEAVNIARSANTAKEASEKLVEAVKYPEDNLSVIVVYLKEKNKWI